MIRISQCMIVKNEEKNIQRALSWGKKLFFEQIVVDTGSTDHTIELAKKFGAAIYYFPWIDDFAAAKNYAIEQAKGDWIAFLDADEYFKENDIAKLKNIIETIDKKTVLLNEGRKRTSALLCTLTNLNYKGEIMSTQGQIRIFRNDENIRYIGKIHEQIAGLNGTKLILADASSNLSIFHTGYGLEKREDRLQKAERNIRLLKKQLELDPDNANWNYYMIDSLSLKGDRKGSIEYINKVLKKKEELTIANGIEKVYDKLLQYILLDTEDKEENLLHMKHFYKEAVSVNSKYPDFDILLAFGYLRKANDWEHALYYLETGLKKLENLENDADKVNGSRWTAYIKEAYYYLVLGYFKKDKVKCVQNAVFYLKIDKFNEEVLRILLSLLKEDTCDNKAIYHFLSQIYQLENKKDSLFVQKAALLEGIIELAEILKTK